MKLSEKQTKTIDALLCTYRELAVVELVDYTIHGMAKGGAVLTIAKRFSYLILSSGEIKEMRQSYNGITFKIIKYFE
jgi:hypothetical protein